mgnify:CR=1 FL=1
MNTKLLVQGISGIIPGGISAEDFAVIISADKNTAKKILSMLTQNGIGQTIGNLVNFEDGDKLKTALFAIKNGVPIEEVSRYIDWKDFEGLVAEILDSKHFDVLRNFRMTKPTMEIDVVGIHLGIAILIDCKHWKRMTQSALNDIVNKGHDSEIPYVRSMYWVYNNMLKEIRAECVHADPPVTVPKWMKKKRDWSIPPDDPMIPPE